MTVSSLSESKLEKPGNTIFKHAYNRLVEIGFQDLQGIEIIFEEQQKDLQIEN